MDLHQKIRTLPTSPGVYLYKNADGEIIYVGKANSLRARVRSYFLEGAAENAKTGSLLREAVDLDYIVVDNEKEALALENNLIKQKKPRYNILLRDDKTYPVHQADHRRALSAGVSRRAACARTDRCTSGRTFRPAWPIGSSISSTGTF